MLLSDYWPTADHARKVKAAGASGMKRVPLAPYFMLALALMGIADAFYVARASYTGQALYEPLIEGANTVLNSPFARIFGLPLSYFGLIYYLSMLGLAALLAFNPFSRVLRACSRQCTSCTCSSTISTRCASTVCCPPSRRSFFSSSRSGTSE